MSILCTSLFCLQLLAGASYETTPPNGTWWQADKPSTFSNLGESYGIALVGKNWSLSAERMGRMSSSAVACGANEPACKNGKITYSHWLGSEQPYGVWAAYEPHFRHFLAQIGVGAVKPDFHMNIPDWNSVGSGPPYDVQVGNNKFIISPLLGVGYETKYGDVLFNWRLVRATNGNGTPTDKFQGEGWGVFNLSLRIKF